MTFWLAGEFDYCRRTTPHFDDRWPTPWNMAAGSRVRIYKLRELAGHSIEVVLHGTLSDADYARELFDQTEGVQTTLPKQLSGSGYSFRAKGTPDLPLTRDRALHILEKDQYVVLLPNAYSERLP